jgi:prevent-host-death family protein
MEWNGKKIKTDNKVVSVAEVKSHFSEYVSKVAYASEKFIITKRGKPLVALVSIEDLKNIMANEEAKGLSEIIGKWKNFEEIEDDINKIYSSRKKDKGRDVSF